MRIVGFRRSVDFKRSSSSYSLHLHADMVVLFCPAEEYNIMFHCVYTTTFNVTLSLDFWRKNNELMPIISFTRVVIHAHQSA